MIKALLFDFDGLILDTETPEVIAWQEVYSRYGVEFPVQLWGKIVGGNGSKDFDPVAYLSEKSSQQIDADLMRADKRVRDRELVAYQAILPGVQDYITTAKAHGLRLAIGSSSNHDWIDTHLKRLGLWDSFDAVICIEDAPRAKPNPDIFLKALEALDVRAEEALAFEDSPNGVTAAKAAGIRVIAVPNPITAQLGVTGADLTLASLADLPLPDLLQRFNVTIRHELPADIPAIHRVNQRAFPQETEANLVDLIRDRGNMTLSLVALNGAEVVGHILFSPVTLQPSQDGLRGTSTGSVRGLGIGPVAVLPEMQDKGFGSRLIEKGLSICRERGYDFIVLLGDPRYYSRFGFIPAAEFGLDNEYGAGEEFQARELKPGILNGTRALVQYVPEFKEVGC
jgi:HAD superfamily hydrolase (TIGR01509 family)